MKKSFIKYFIAFFGALISFSTFADSACGYAVSTNDPGFCTSFRTIAECNCRELSPVKKICSGSDSMQKIYDMMLATHSFSVQKACEYAHFRDPKVSVQECMDDWSCYRNGGKDSEGRLCSSTGNSCG